VQHAKKPKPEKKPRLWERVIQIIEENSDESSELLIGKVTKEEFEQFLEEDEERVNKKKPGNRYFWRDDNLFVLLPIGPVHSATVMKIALLIGDAHWEHMTGNTLTAPTVGGAAGFVAQPDGSIIPNGLPLPAQSPFWKGPLPWPTVIIEVGDSQKLSALHQRANLWLGANTGVQVVLVFKYYKKYNNGHYGMLALRYERGNGPTFAVSFGTHQLSQATRNSIPGGIPLTGVGENTPAGPAYPACNALGLPDYQLRIPTALLFAGVPTGVPGGLGANVTMDLFVIQQRAFNVS